MINNFLDNFKNQTHTTGFGCEQLGGYQWGHVDIEETTKAIHEAIESGITFFDTADCYGKGASEINLGKAIKEKRSQVIISTKFGVRFNSSEERYYDSSVNWMEKALEDSLRRINTEYIDLYFIHYPDPRTPWDEIFQALEKKVEEGKIRAYGISNISLETRPSLLPPHCVAFQSAFSLCDRSSEPLVVTLHKKLKPVFFGCLAQGLLSGKYDENTKWDPSDRRGSSRYRNFHGEVFERNLRILKTARSVADSLNTDVATLALAYLFKRFPTSLVLLGIKSRQQLSPLKKAVDLKIDTLSLQKLENIF